MKTGELRIRVPSRKRVIIVTAGLACLAAILLAGWVAAGYPLFLQGEKYAYNPEERGDLCPRREPGLRNVPCVLPDIPHLVTLEGFVPPNYRTKKFHYSTNSMMYRGEREFPRTKEPGVFRIIVLGTGVSFGNGVDDEHVYSAILQDKLDRVATAERRFEVFNMAIPGSTTDIGVRELDRITREFQFDQIVFCYGVNDGLPMFERPEERYAGTLLHMMRMKRERQMEMMVAVEPRSSFYPWPYEGYKAKFDQIVGEDPHTDVIDLPAVIDEVEKHHGLRLVRDGNRQQVVEYHWGRPRVLFETEYEVAEGVQSVAPAVYDFLDTHRVHQACYIDGVHLSEEGMRVVADVLFDYLVARGVAG